MNPALDVRKLPVLNFSELRLFTSHLSILLGSGVDLIKSLDVLSNSPLERFGPVAARIAYDVETGRTLSGAMESQPMTFPDGYIRVVQIAELGGGMVVVLDRLARRLEEQGKTRQRIQAAVVYPAFLIVSSALMVSLLVYLLLPMLLTVTVQAGVEPPYLTQLLVKATSARFTCWVAALAGGCYLIFSGLRDDPVWGPMLRRGFERLPWIGNLWLRWYLAASLRELAFLLATGIDLLVALRCARRLASPCLILHEAYTDVIAEVREGNLIYESMEKVGTFPIDLIAMVSVGEYGGDLHRLLASHVDLMDHDLTYEIDQMVLLLEPAILIGMGVVVGGILLAAFLPIYSLIQL